MYSPTPSLALVTHIGCLLCAAAVVLDDNGRALSVDAFLLVDSTGSSRKVSLHPSSETQLRSLLTILLNRDTPLVRGSRQSVAMALGSTVTGVL